MEIVSCESVRMLDLSDTAMDAADAKAVAAIDGLGDTLRGWLARDGDPELAAGTARALWYWANALNNLREGRALMAGAN